MGKIIKDYWGKLWEKDPGEPNEEHMTSYLNRKYNKKLNPDKITKPSLDVVTNTILGSNNSSSGPDGIPFSAYRALVDIVAPCLLDLITKLLAGGELPPDFNLGLLHIIPKKDTLRIADTRPITVNNAGNRLIAAVVVECITPAWDDMLNRAQKLFIKGRVMTEHVWDINETYYASLNKKEQMILLFIDTRKAFESIHHTFIRSILKGIDAPPWLKILVDGLLSNVEVSPVLANDKKLRILILRGVKQGCPLSPLLFVLCMDVLMEIIQDQKNAPEMFAAADDLAFASKYIEQLYPVMKAINTFSRHTGLGINHDKSAVLPAIPELFNENAIANSPWPELKVVSRYKHLGVLMGYDIDTEIITQAAHNKAMSRLETFRTRLKILPIHKRITIINTFITSIYSYLGQFIILPNSISEEYLKRVHTIITPYNGTAFALEILFGSGELPGFSPSLRSPWVASMAALASKAWENNPTAEDLKAFSDENS